MPRFPRDLVAKSLFMNGVVCGLFDCGLETICLHNLSQIKKKKRFKVFDVKLL